jgi:hypothetical protein
MILAVGPLSVLIVAAGIVAGIMVGAKQNRLSIGKYLETLPLTESCPIYTGILHERFCGGSARYGGAALLIRDYDEAAIRKPGS